MDSDEYRFDDSFGPEEAEVHPEPDPEPDAFARMVSVLRVVTGYDPGAEDEAHDELAAGRTVRWIGRTVLFAALTLGVLNAPAIHGWATTLAPTWGAETVRELSEVWDRRLADVGLDVPRATIRGWYDALKSAPPAPAAHPPAGPAPSSD